MGEGEGHFDVVARFSDPKKELRSTPGYLEPYYGFMHFIMVADTGISYADWITLPGQPEIEFRWQDFVVFLWRYVTDPITCADKRAWRAIMK